MPLVDEKDYAFPNIGNTGKHFVPSPTMADFQSDPVFFRCIIGPFGSGKSSYCINEVITLASLQRRSPIDGVRRSKWAVVRNTFPDLKYTTIATWTHWYSPERWGRFVWSPHPEYHMRWRLKDGSIVESLILFTALETDQDVKHLLSLDITGYWINEIRETSVAVKNGLDGRCGRYPPSEHGGASWRGGLADSNPWHTDHPLHTLLEESPPANHRLFKQPSGLAADAENLENLEGAGKCERHRAEDERLLEDGKDPPIRGCRDCGRAYYENMMQGKSAEWVNVFVHGRYGFLVDGRPVYRDMYYPQLHDSRVLLDPVKGFEIIEGTDWGLTPSTIWLQVLPGPRVRFLRELCQTHMGAERHAEDLLAFRAVAFPGWPAKAFKGYADPAGWTESQTDERTCEDIFRAKGIVLFKGAVDFAARFEAMAHIFRLTYDGRGAVQIDPRCKIFKRAMLGGYHYRKLQRSGAEPLYSEKPEKNHPYSDIANAAEYPVSKLFNVAQTARMESAKKEESVRARWREVHGIKPKGTRKGGWATR